MLTTILLCLNLRVKNDKSFVSLQITGVKLFLTDTTENYSVSQYKLLLKILSYQKKTTMLQNVHFSRSNWLVIH